MKHPTYTRRRFMSICAAASALSVMPFASALAAVPLHRWNGILLGSYVTLTLAHPNKQEAERIFALSVREIKRLENIFTLYDNRSELSRLNANRVLPNPSPEMIDILRAAQHYSAMTEGAFDVTVKALEDGQDDLELVGMDNLDIQKNVIRLTKAKMGVTLNGIAQGFITDCITQLLKEEGLSNVLVELGEKRAIGNHPEGRPWFLQTQGHNTPIALLDQALASSAAKNPNTGSAHIYDPKSGKPAYVHQTISVRAKTATMADALSTGFMNMKDEHINRVKNAHKDIYAVYKT